MAFVPKTTPTKTLDDKQNYRLEGKNGEKC